MARLFRKSERGPWYGEYRDVRGCPRRIALVRDKHAAATALRALVEAEAKAAAGEIVHLHEVPPLVRRRLAEDLERAGLKVLGAEDATICELLDRWGRTLRDRGNTAKHVNLSTRRAARVFAEAGCTRPHEIELHRVEAVLASWRRAGMSIETSNHHARAAKSFTKWLAETGTLAIDPLKPLRRLNPEPDRRVRRRALSDEEAARLISATMRGPERQGVSGRDRAVAYAVALRTGLRLSELRSLRRCDFDLSAATVRVRAAYSKHRREDLLPLHPDLLAMLREHLAGKLPEAPALRLPRRPAEALREDAEAAGIDPEGLDFHALRHAFITHLARSGVHPKVAQTLARHSTVTLTLDRYSHVVLDDQAAAIARLPSIEMPAACQKTGTTDRPSRNGARLGAHFGSCSVRESARLSQGPESGQRYKPRQEGTLGDNCGHHSTAPGRTRTCDLRIRSPLLYPS